MSIVTLVSGGLDSTLIAYLAKEQGIEQFPLFIDYGQRAKTQELSACKQAMKSIGLNDPEVMNLGDFGRVIGSGLTNKNLRVLEDAFTPGRNTLFILMAASYAAVKGADSISIGLLHPDTCLFSDQTDAFLSQAEILIGYSVGRPIRILTPLREFYKQDVVRLAAEKNISNTYSCHLGEETPCGNCISCNEFKFEEVSHGRK